MNVLKKMLLVTGVWLGIFALFFTVGEISFRLFRHEQSPLADITQKKKEFLLPPDTSKQMSSSIPGEFNYTYHINHFGYRGKDFSLEKSPGTLRVLAVGDSFVFGVGSEDG